MEEIFVKHDIGVLVSNFGNIIIPATTHTKEHITKGTDNGRYYKIKYNQKCYYVHRIVADVFCEKQNGNVVDHIDGNRYNNNSTNLRWCTTKENVNNPVTYKRLVDAHNTNEYNLKMKHIRSKSKPHSDNWKAAHSAKLTGRHRIYNDDGTWHMSK